jgi:hypothetical protein
MAFGNRFWKMEFGFWVLKMTFGIWILGFENDFWNLDFGFLNEKKPHAPGSIGFIGSHPGSERPAPLTFSGQDDHGGDSDGDKREGFGGHVIPLPSLFPVSIHMDRARMKGIDRVNQKPTHVTLSHSDTSHPFG